MRRMKKGSKQVEKASEDERKGGVEVEKWRRKESEMDVRRNRRYVRRVRKGSEDEQN